jgi:hypothetical protein
VAVEPETKIVTATAVMVAAETAQRKSEYLSQEHQIRAVEAAAAQSEHLDILTSSLRLADLALSSSVTLIHMLLQRLPQDHRHTQSLAATASTNGLAPARLRSKESSWRTLHNSIRTTSSLR